MERLEPIVAQLRQKALASRTSLVAVAVLLTYAAADTKALPFAYTLKIIPSLYRLLKPRLFRRRRTLVSPPTSASLDSPVVAARTALFEHHTTRSRATLSDLGINTHKSNSTYLLDGDLSRANLLTELFSDALAVLGPAIFLLESVQCRWHRQIPAFQAYTVNSRVLAWNDRSLYLITYFLKAGTELPRELDVLGGPAAVLADDEYGSRVHAVLVSKHVFKARGETLSPDNVLKTAGLLASHRKDDTQDTTAEHDGEFLGMDAVQKAVENGLDYIRSYME
jgi:hypothetical protein